MPSQLKLLRESRKTGTFDFVDKRINRRISASNTRKGYSLSPDDKDDERIIEDYIEEDYLEDITSKEKAKKAVKSLEEGNAKRGLVRDFVNYIAGTGRKKLVNKIYEKYALDKIKIIKDNKISLKSKKERTGYKVNSKSYLIVIKTKSGKEYIQARSFNDGRVVKMPKNINIGG